MVEYLSGGRIQGSSSLAATPKTGWKLLARKSNGSGDSIDSGAFTAKDNLMIISSTDSGSSAATAAYRFNTSGINDSSTEYVYRVHTGASGSNDAPQHHSKPWILNGLGYANEQAFSVGYVRNTTGLEKLLIGDVCAAPTDTQVQRRAIYGKYVPSNLNTDITRVYMVDKDENDFSGSDNDLVVLGMDDDEADSGLDGVWQNLGVARSAANDTTSLEVTLSSSKKYLWIQAQIKTNGTSATKCKLTFNGGDSSSNYSNSYNNEMSASADSGSNNDDYIYSYTNNDDHSQMLNAFVVDRASKEKLVIWSASDAGDAQNGGTSAQPDTRIGAASYQQTARITTVKLTNNQSGGEIDTGSYIRVWGFD